MEARIYAADVPAGVTGAAGGCSPHERRDKREQSRYRCAHARHACYSFAPRDAFLAALRADQRARSRFTARTVMGATTCNAMEAAPATSPLTRSNASSGPKYHMTPRPCRRGTAGQRWAKKKMEKPRPSPAGPQKKSLYAIVSARRQTAPTSNAGVFGAGSARWSTGWLTFLQVGLAVTVKSKLIPPSPRQWRRRATALCGGNCADRRNRNTWSRLGLA
jgi:hypothetical protein